MSASVTQGGAHQTGDAALVLSRELLRAIDGHRTSSGFDPTIAELAVDIGIPADLSDHLGTLMDDEVEAHRLSCHSGRYRLTEAGRLRIDGQA